MNLVSYKLYGENKTLNGLKIEEKKIFVRLKFTELRIIIHFFCIFRRIDGKRCFSARNTHNS